MTSNKIPLPAIGETKFVETPDGRSLAYLEFGDPSAPLVIHNHGGPGSRIEGQVIAHGAINNGLRLVAVDRPGMGKSSPQPDHTYESWSRDLAHIADALGYQEFGISGWSGGGPFPIAAAFYIDPARLKHVTSIAGGNFGTLGENWAAQYQDKADALGGKLAIHHKLAFHLMYEILALDAKHFRKSYVQQIYKTLNDYDQRVLDQPDVAENFGEAAAECFAQGSIGLVDDTELLYRAWPFAVAEIERPVHMWQGTDDHLIPLPINKEIAEQLPGSVWHEVEGGGHFIAIGEADSIFAVAAQELGV